MTGRRHLTDEENHCGHVVRGLIRDGVVGREFLRLAPEASYKEIVEEFYPLLSRMAYPPDCPTRKGRIERDAYRALLSILNAIIKKHPAPGFMMTPEARQE